MKNFVIAIALALFAISCGTKESSVSSGTDSTSVDTSTTMAPATVDTMTTNMNTSDSINMTTDSVATPATR